MMPDQLLQKLKSLIEEKDFDDIKLAFLKAEQAHKGQQRYSGQPYIIHPLNVCILLVEELKIKDKSILLIAMLHDVLEDTNMTYEEIEKLFGQKVADGVNLLTKHKDYKKDITQQKKYFWHLKRATKNIQIVKLADRLNNLRDLKDCQENLKRRKYIMDTAYNYLEWAKKVSPYIAGELEDLIFKYREELGDIEL